MATLEDGCYPGRVVEEAAATLGVVVAADRMAAVEAAEWEGCSAMVEVVSRNGRKGPHPDKGSPRVPGF